MSTVTIPSLISAEQFAEMHFDGPCELVRGEIVELTRPSWAHGAVMVAISTELAIWARRTGAGRVSGADPGVLTGSNSDTLRGPDVLFVRNEVLVNGVMPTRLTKLIPTLCVEVLSPSNRSRDVEEKVQEYLSSGVEEVWTANLDSHTIEVCRLDQPTITFQGDDLLTRDLLPGFAVPVSRFFEGV